MTVTAACPPVILSLSLWNVHFKHLGNRKINHALKSDKKTNGLKILILILRFCLLVNLGKEDFMSN